MAHLIEMKPAIDSSIAGIIDHTLLRPEATRDDILKICREARQYSHFGAAAAEVDHLS